MTDARTRGHRLRPGLIVFAVVLAAVGALTVLVAQRATDHAADLTGYPAGITGAAVTRASSLAENSNVPAAIMAALPQAYGADPTRPARSYTRAQQTAAVQNRTPIGPYQLVYNDVYAFAKTYHVTPLSFSEMADPIRSGNWVVGAIAAVIHSKHLTYGAVNFTAGTSDQPSFNPSTNRIDQRTVIQTSAAASWRASARRSWISILSALPVSDLGGHAPSIYDTAFHWTMTGALSQVCGGLPLAYANAAVVPVSGLWTNPVASTGVSAPFVAGTHSGVDLAAAAGASVYAVTSGQVKLVGSGATKTLVLYTGNALTLVYQGIGTEAVSDGQQVRVGQRLGTVSASPSDDPAAGPHLHLGVNTVHAYANNAATWADPVGFLRVRGVILGSATVGVIERFGVTSGTTVRTTEAASSFGGLMDVWQGSQLSIAAAIIATGERMHVPAWGIQTALMTAMQGSRLGIEPPNSGSPRGPLALPGSWGSVSARTNVVTSAQMFYTRLLKVTDWQAAPPWVLGARLGVYAAPAVESYRAKWSGAGVLMNAVGLPGTTSMYGTDGTTGGGCTGAPTSGTPTVDLSAGFRVANFNLFGCTESYNATKSGWLSCTQRVPLQWSYINQHGFSIVGLQEMEPAPFALFQQRVNAAGSTWAMYPQSPTFVHQQTTAVLWRTDQWQMLSSSQFQITKYAWTDCSTGAPVTHTTPANEAVVLLRNAAGQKLWVLSIHNIAGMDATASAGNCHPTPANASFNDYLAKLFPSLWAKDVSLEASQFAHTYATGIPVLLMGDFNDDTVKTICSIKWVTPSAHSIWDPIPAGGCEKPSTTRGQPYDKIIGSGGVLFTQNGIDWSTQTDGPTVKSSTGKTTTTGITDHGVPSTLAKLP